LKFVQSLSPEELHYLKYDWNFWGRPNQLPPSGDWRTWLVLAGRGFGKTRIGSEFVRAKVEAGEVSRIALVGRTTADVRDTMIEGESGIISVSPPWNRPHYEPSKRKLSWPNGAIATTYSADLPDQMRGPQSDLAWADELASWSYPEALDMLLFGLRLGADPKLLVTTTPRPIKMVIDLMNQSTTVVTRGSSYENKANLAPAFINEILSKYEGTRMGRQEIMGEILTDVVGALWKSSLIDECRVRDLPKFKRVVVAIDPAVTSDERSDETGIMVVGKAEDDHAYVIEDLSGRLSAEEWGKRAIGAFHKYSADRIVAEVNNGGDLVEKVLRTIDRNIGYKGIRATKGKILRAEPVAALYEQKRVHHVGQFMKLEEEMCVFSLENLRDNNGRVDSLVYGVSELMLVNKEFVRGHVLP
jgi:predicted phage terminase large subunit-like protein